MESLLETIMRFLEIESLAVERLPSLHGKTRAEARLILKQYGFVFKGIGKNLGYEMWEHSDKSRIDIRPEGTLAGPKGEVCRSQSWKRYDQNGKQIQSHNSSEIVVD